MDFDNVDKNIMKVLDRNMMLACFADFCIKSDDPDKLLDEMLFHNKELLLRTFDAHYGVVGSADSEDAMDAMFGSNEAEKTNHRKAYEAKIDKISELYRTAIKEVMAKSV